MLGTPAEALTKLIGEGRQGKGGITGSTSGIRLLRNGIKYYAVDVTFEDGRQYGISAYDEEAEELFNVSKTICTQQEKAGERTIPLVTA